MFKISVSANAIYTNVYVCTVIMVVYTYVANKQSGFICWQNTIRDLNRPYFFPLTHCRVIFTQTLLSWHFYGHIIGRGTEYCPCFRKSRVGNIDAIPAFLFNQQNIREYRVRAN